jgi:hypothetical protein
MSLKLLFRFNDRDSISRLYQIANVSHPQNNSQLLKDMVLQPIGESLKLIVDGGSFIVQRDNDTNMIVSFNLMVTTLLLFGLNCLLLFVLNYIHLACHCC